MNFVCLCFTAFYNRNQDFNENLFTFNQLTFEQFFDYYEKWYLKCEGMDPMCICGKTQHKGPIMFFKLGEGKMDLLKYHYVVSKIALLCCS